MTLEHGGRLELAVREYEIPREAWVDLSTGISPSSWPVPTVPGSVWQRLPEEDGALESAAADYYGCERTALLPVPGSQYALQYAPGLLPAGRVAMPQRGYTEHRCAWAAAGHRVVEYTDWTTLQALLSAEEVDHVLLINPNNPSAEQVSREHLESLHRRLQSAGGFLVVDEAFADVSPEVSLASLCPAPGLIVYRSVGKFFGLAGIRLGFLLAEAPLCRKLQAQMPPWSLSHPARWIGEAALADRRWQLDQRTRLVRASQAWFALLQDAIPDLEFKATALFATGAGDWHHCDRLYRALARRAVLTRLFEDIAGQGMLRFGLPPRSRWQETACSIHEAVRECECVIA